MKNIILIATAWAGYKASVHVLSWSVGFVLGFVPSLLGVNDAFLERYVFPLAGFMGWVVDFAMFAAIVLLASRRCAHADTI